MAKNEQMLRLLFIEEFLRRRKDRGATYPEIADYLESQFAEKGLELKFTERTFQRDKLAIADVFGIQISYSRKKNAHFIEEEELELSQESVFDQLLLVEAYRETKGKADVMFFEPRRARGLEHLNGLIHAITQKKVLSFTYQKFWEEELSQRLVEPYALKEFKNRWYIMAKDSKDNNIKSFALDRLTNLEITNLNYQYPDNYSIEQSYRYCFGIISPNDEEPQDIILSFDPFQGKYIKTLPLHDTQQVLVDNDEEMKIKLKLCLTHDLVMELLSFGDNLKVIEPKSLADQIKQAHEKAYRQY